MATVDELVVKYVLDITGFTQGQKAAADATRKLKEGVVADAKATEESVAKVTSGVEALGRKFLSLYALVTAGRGLREFVSDLTGADSALGRTARNIDIGAKALSTWQLAAEASGGSAAGITGTMRTLSGELQRAALTGTSSIIPAFRALGINLATTGGKARDVRDILTDMNRRAQGMDPAKFTALANLAGISDEGTISMLEMKTTEFDKLIAAQEKYAATAADVDAAQKRQSGWRELLITSTSIGRTILTAVTPALLAMMKAVQDWANGKDWTKLSRPISDFLDTLTNADWKGFIERAEAFATKLATIATAADDAAKGIDGNSTLFKGLEALTALIGLRLLGSVVGLVAGLSRLGSISIGGPLGALLLNPAILGTAAVGAVLASGDPNKALIDGGRPDVRPQDNDLGLPGVGDRSSGLGDAGAKTGGFLAWMKETAKKLGFGDRLHDDPKTKDDISDTAKATKGILDVMRNGASAIGGALGFGGVTESSGGLGGSGRHVGGGSSPGASLGDHARGGIGRGAAAMAAGARESFEFWKSKGLTPEQAAGLAGMEQGESRFDPRAVGDHGEAHGAFQWHANRRAQIKAATGVDIDTATHKQQLEVAYWEFIHTEQNAWAAVKRGRTATDAARAGVTYFERPGDKVGQSIVRGGMAEGWLKRFNEEDAKAKGNSGAGTPAPSAAAVTDAEVFAARQRLLNGSRDPKDRALIDRYLKQQNTPPAKPEPGHAPTLHHVAHAVLGALHHARGLIQHNDNHPVPVTMGDRTADNIGKRTFGRYLDYAKKHQGEMPHALAPWQHVSELSNLSRSAALARHAGALNHTVHNVDNSSATTIASMTVHTRAENGRDLAADLERHLARNREVAQSNSGLA